MRETNNYREHLREENSAMAFASMGAKFKLPSGNILYLTQIHGHVYHLVSLLYSNEANKTGFRQHYIFDAADSTTKLVANQSNEEFLAEKCNYWPKCCDKSTQLLSHVNECINRNEI
jgi:hypothetical protein